MSSILSLWPSTIDGSDTVLIALAVLVAGLIRGFSGFGSAMVLAPAFAISVGPATGVPLLILLDLLVVAVVLPPVLKTVAWRRVTPLALGALITLPFGAQILLVADEETLRRGIGLIILLFVGFMASGWRYRGQPTLPMTLGTGAASGVLTAATGIGGPPVILFFVGQHGAQAAGIRAGLVAYFALLSFGVMVTFAALGLVTDDVLRLALWLIAPYTLACWLGSRLFGRVSESLFRRTVLVFVAVMAGWSLAG